MKKTVTLLRVSLLFIVAMLGFDRAQASTDYGPAMWISACPGHWSTYHYKRSFFVIHDIEGYFQTMINSMHNCYNTVSVHYAANGKDDGSNDPYNAGKIAQLVRDEYSAWHARCWNYYSMGTEHEGFVSNPAWWTEAMYQSSADLTRSKCDKYNIPKDRNHIIAHGQKLNAAWRTWMSNQGWSSEFINCNDHTDPGPYWDWPHYMDLVNGIASTPSRPTSLTATAVSSSRIDLKWEDNSTIENGFEIQQSGTSNDGPWNSIHNNNSNDKTYSVTGLSANKQYWFRVRAYNAAGNSEWSGVHSATTWAANPPALPTSFTATAANDDRVNLSWIDNASNEDNYNVQRSTDGTTWTLIAELNPNTTSYVDTPLAGNRTYYYRLKCVNEAGGSGWTPVVNVTTPPTAPGSLAATAVSSSKINLAWSDNSGAEVGFKIQRSPTGSGSWSDIATNSASDATYSDTGLAASTTYYYRVCSYNANGNSAWSNTAHDTTRAAPPELSALSDQTVAPNSKLTFTAVSTDPNKTTGGNNWSDLTSYSDGTTGVLFRNPEFAGQTSGFIDTTATNFSRVVTSFPSGHGSSKVIKSQWNFKTGTTNPYMQLSTMNCPNGLANPTIVFAQSLRFDVYCTKDVTLGVGVRETYTTAAIGADGGTSGTREWVGVTNVVATDSPQCAQFVAKSNWTTVTINIPLSSVTNFPGEGNALVEGVKGVFNQLLVVPQGGTGKYELYTDNFKVWTNNTLTFSLSNAPAGATIGAQSGVFSWTPTSGQSGQYNITVIVTDQLGYTDSETFKVTVSGAVNNPPALAKIGNKTVNEGTALTFTASATDPDASQTLTYSLDAGAPAGASINTSSGAFTWTPTESQGPGSYPITVRVRDNGSPQSNDWETITVTVNEVNVAPALASIANQSVNEGQTFSLTASATDADIPANTVTYSLASAPVGMTINTNTGAISWATSEATGPDTVQVVVRATDNGSPKLYAERTFTLTVNEVNVAPTLVVSNSISTLTKITDFENYANNTYNGTVMFRQPSYSSSTSAFLDTATANDTTVTTNSPGTVRSSVMQASFAFKTGQTNPWLRMTTAAPFGSEYSLPNPTVDLGKHLKFDIYSDKSIKICLGIRESGTQNPIGSDGGTTGNIEFVGASSKNGTAPAPSRTIAANTWTTVDFDLPHEGCVAFTGDGALAPGKGVLEHIAIVPNGGTGVHNVYVDNFEVYSSSTNMTVNTGEEITLNCTASDADRPNQALTFSLDAGAPTNAVINDLTGTFTWTPTADQSPSTNVIGIRVTDDGSPALSSVQNVTIKVIKVNTPPSLNRPDDIFIEQNSAISITVTNEATDDDIPANTLSFSLTGSVPAGASINASSGVFTWTPPTSTLTNYYITVRVTDNGNPPLYTEQQFAVNIVPANTAPSLSLTTARMEEVFANYETFANNTAAGTIMFRNPNNSTTTSAFIDSTQTNYTKITNSIPAGNTNVGSRALVAKWNFKTGTSNYWVRLHTAGVTSLPNPTVDLRGRVKFDIYTSKKLRVGLGIRETGTTAGVGADGGTTGTIEWIGVTNVVNGSPFPSRVVNSNTWTTLEFDLRNEPIRTFNGDGILTNQNKGVLEHLALFGDGGTGAYTVYLDNFSAVTTSSLPATVSIKAGSTLTFTAIGTDPNPGSGLFYGIDSDFAGAHTNAIMNATNGAFVWTPATADVDTTNLLEVSVQDSPTNNGIARITSTNFSIVVTSDNVGPQSASSGFVAAGETITLVWDAIPNKIYQVQYKGAEDAEWSNLGDEVVAGSVSASVVLENTDEQRLYRVIAVGDVVTDQ